MRKETEKVLKGNCFPILATESEEVLVQHGVARLVALAGGECRAQEDHLEEPRGSDLGFEGFEGGG